jgi:hypothetical protein
VFALASIIAISTYMVFQIFGTSDIQPWNYPEKKYLPEENQILREQSTIINETGDDYDMNGLCRDKRRSN